MPRDYLISEIATFSSSLSTFCLFPLSFSLSICLPSLSHTPFRCRFVSHSLILSFHLFIKPFSLSYSVYETFLYLTPSNLFPLPFLSHSVSLSNLSLRSFPYQTFLSLSHFISLSVSLLNLSFSISQSIKPFSLSLRLSIKPFSLPFLSFSQFYSPFSLPLSHPFCLSFSLTNCSEVHITPVSCWLVRLSGKQRIKWRKM